MTMDVDKALADVDAAWPLSSVSIEASRVLADRVRATADRDEWKGVADARRAIVDSYGGVLACLRQERDDVRRDLDTMTKKAKAWETAAADRGRQLETAVAERESFRADKDTWQRSAERLGQACRDANTNLHEAQAELDEAREDHAQELRRVNVELDVALAVWSDFREFLRTALNLDEDTLADEGEVRQRVGELVKDSRLLARVRDEVNGQFVAGTMPAYGQLDEMQREPWRIGVFPDNALKIDPKRMVWVASEGTDPHDMAKWTPLGTAYQSVIVENRKPLPKMVKSLFGDTTDTCTQEITPPRLFPVGSAEPKGVTRVKRDMSSVTFTRIGRLPNGEGVWKRDDTTTDAVLRWANIVGYLAVVDVS